MGKGNGRFIRVLGEPEFSKLSGKIGKDGRCFNERNILYETYLTNVANLLAAIAFECYINADEDSERYYLYKLIDAISVIDNIDYLDYEWLIGRDYSVFDGFPEFNFDDPNVDENHFYERVKKLIWCNSETTIKQ